MCEFDGGRAGLWMGSKGWVDNGWVGGLAVAMGGCVGCGGSVVGCVFCFLFLYFCFGGCDSSGCGLIFMGCDGLMSVGGGSCGLILVVLFFCIFWWLWPQQYFW